MDATFLDNAQRIFDTACSDASAESKDFALLIRHDGGLHFVMDSGWSLETAAACHGARTAYRVTKSATGTVRVTGRSGNRECVLEQLPGRSLAAQLLRDQPVYEIQSPLMLGQRLMESTRR